MQNSGNDESGTCPVATLADKFPGSRAEVDTQPYDKIIINGGGLAGIFTAYKLLQKSEEAGKKLDILVIAEKLSAPCTAGTHAVLELEGMFDEGFKNREAVNALLRDGLSDLEQTIKNEQIDCRFERGYEIKGVRIDELKGLVDDMIERKMYNPEEIKFNSGREVFNLPGHAHSVSIDSIGQLNMPELIAALTDRIQDMGARVIIGARYENQSVDKDGLYTVHTNVGDFKSYAKPFMATGAAHQQTLPGVDKIKTEVVHTMGLVLGPLSEQDREKMSKGPMAICNTDLNGDVLWGGLDSKHYFTIGRGDIVNPTDQDFDALYHNIAAQIDSMYPGLTKKYPPTISFGPMLIAENRMPIVGRMKDFDVAGGWAGMGVVAGFAAADAYADWIVHGNDEKLKLFETMQPGKFSPEFAPSLPANTLENDSI